MVTADCYELMVGRAWAGEARGLVVCLLRVDPGERPTAAAILEHSGRRSNREEERGMKRAGDGEEPAGKRRRGPTEGAFGLASEERGR